MKRHCFSCLLLCCMILLSWNNDLYAIMVGENLDMGGYIQNETAFSVNEKGDTLWCENKLLVYGAYNFTPQIRTFFRVQGYYDAINDIQAHDYRDISDERYMDRQTYFRKNLWQPRTYTSSEYLKELFVDIDLDAFDLRIGKQQFAWGVTDGLKVLDIIYPQDFRKFNQEDFEESRIPLWSLKLDYCVGDSSEIQLVYLPNFEPAFFPGGGHPFATWNNEFFDVLDIYGTSGTDFKVKYDEPDDTFYNGEYGAMWKQNLGSWSYSLNFLSHFTDVAGAYQTGMTGTVIAGAGPGGSDLFAPTFIELTLKNQRMYSFGGSFDSTLSHLPGIGTVIVRAEGIYNINNIMVNVPDAEAGFVAPGVFGTNYLPFPVTGPSGDVVWDAGMPFPETVKVDDWTYALGIDKYIFTDYFLSFQFIQHHLMDYQSSFVNPVTGKHADQNDYWCTFLIQKDWLNEKMWTKVLNVAGRHGDYWIQPQVSYLFRDKYKATVQMNFYGGTKDCMWSRFDSSDNIALRLTYQF